MWCFSALPQQAGKTSCGNTLSFVKNSWISFQPSWTKTVAKSCHYRLCSNGTHPCSAYTILPLWDTSSSADTRTTVFLNGTVTVIWLQSCSFFHCSNGSPSSSKKLIKFQPNPKPMVSNTCTYQLHLCKLREIRMQICDWLHCVERSESTTLLMATYHATCNKHIQLWSFRNKMLSTHYTSLSPRISRRDIESRIWFSPSLDFLTKGGLLNIHTVVWSCTLQLFIYLFFKLAVGYSS